MAQGRAGLKPQLGALQYAPVERRRGTIEERRRLAAFAHDDTCQAFRGEGLRQGQGHLHLKRFTGHHVQQRAFFRGLDGDGLLSSSGVDFFKESVGSRHYVYLLKWAGLEAPALS